MAVLARASRGALEQALAGLPEAPAYATLRAPETGLVMVRGRAGGTGTRFNLGEMAATRCVVALADGTQGHAYVAGRDKRKAELAALFDALMQRPASRPAIEAALLAPERARIAATRRQEAREAAATRVEFFTMVRGEDA